LAVGAASRERRRRRCDRVTSKTFSSGSSECSSQKVSHAVIDVHAVGCVSCCWCNRLGSMAGCCRCWSRERGCVAGSAVLGPSRRIDPLWRGLARDSSVSKLSYPIDSSSAGAGTYLTHAHATPMPMRARQSQCHHSLALLPQLGWRCGTWRFCCECRGSAVLCCLEAWPGAHLEPAGRRSDGIRMGRSTGLCNVI
jgi:hypothetical protein